MKITFNQLRNIKHQLPTGSVKKIAEALGEDEQTIRNYFGAKKYMDGEVVSTHIEPGPDGGIVHLNRTDILDMAKDIIKKTGAATTV